MSSTRAISLEDTTVIRPDPQRRDFHNATFDSLLKYTKSSNGITIFGFTNCSLDQDSVDQDSFKLEIWNRSLNSDIVILDLSNVDFIDDAITANLMAINKKLRELELYS